MGNPTIKELTEFMKEFLIKNDSIASNIELEPSTDLVSLGVESIQLLTLLSLIEKQYSLSISLEKLEKHNFSFSAGTLLDIITE